MDDRIFPLVNEDFLRQEGSRVFLLNREPLDLDAAHSAFLEAALRGGMTVDNALDAVPEETFVDGQRPATESLLAQLKEERTIFSLEGFLGLHHYDAVVVYFEREHFPEVPQVLKDAIAGVPEGQALLFFTSCEMADLPPWVHQVVFKRNRGSGIGTPYRFLQFARHVIGHLPATRVFVNSIFDALFMLGSLKKHELAIGVRSTLFPFLVSAPFIEDDAELLDSELYAELLYWLRTIEEHEHFSQSVRDVRSAQVAGLRILRRANVLMLASPSLHRVLERSADLASCQRQVLSVHGLQDFFCPTSPLPTARALDEDGSLHPSEIQTRTVQLEHRSKGDGPLFLLACPMGLVDLMAIRPIIARLRVREPRAEIRLLVKEAPISNLVEAFPEIDSVVYLSGLDEERMGTDTPCSFVRRLPCFQEPCAFRHLFDGPLVRQMNEVLNGWSLGEGFGAQLDLTLHRNEWHVPLGSSSSRKAQAPASPRVLFALSGGKGTVTNDLPWRNLAAKVCEDFGFEQIDLALAAEPGFEVSQLHPPQASSGLAMVGHLSSANAVVTNCAALAALGESLGVGGVWIDDGHESLSPFPGAGERGFRKCASHRDSDLVSSLEACLRGLVRGPA